MGVRLVVGTADGTTPAAVLYDSVSGWTIGPVIEATETADAEGRAEVWLRWFYDGTALSVADEKDIELPRQGRDPTDPRAWSEQSIKQLWRLFREQELAAKV